MQLKYEVRLEVELEVPFHVVFKFSIALELRWWLHLRLEDSIVMPGVLVIINLNLLSIGLEYYQAQW